MTIAIIGRFASILNAPAKKEWGLGEWGEEMGEGRSAGVIA